MFRKRMAAAEVDMAKYRSVWLQLAEQMTAFLADGLERYKALVVRLQHLYGDLGVRFKARGEERQRRGSLTMRGADSAAHRLGLLNRGRRTWSSRTLPWSPQRRPPTLGQPSTGAW